MDRLGDADLISSMLTIGREVRTLQLEQHALTSRRDLCPAWRILSIDSGASSLLQLDTPTVRTCTS